MVLLNHSKKVISCLLTTIFVLSSLSSPLFHHEHGAGNAEHAHQHPHHHSSPHRDHSHKYHTLLTRQCHTHLSILWIEITLPWQDQHHSGKHTADYSDLFHVDLVESCFTQSSFLQEHKTEYQQINSPIQSNLNRVSTHLTPALLRTSGHIPLCDVARLERTGVLCC